MFEISFWKVLPSHGSLIKKKKEKKYIYIRTFPAFFLVTSMGNINICFINHNFRQIGDKSIYRSEAYGVIKKRHFIYI